MTLEELMKLLTARTSRDQRAELFSKLAQTLGKDGMAAIRIPGSNSAGVGDGGPWDHTSGAPIVLDTCAIEKTEEQLLCTVKMFYPTPHILLVDVVENMDEDYLNHWWHLRNVWEMEQRCPVSVTAVALNEQAQQQIQRGFCQPDGKIWVPTIIGVQPDAHPPRYDTTLPEYEENVAFLKSVIQIALRKHKLIASKDSLQALYGEKDLRTLETWLLMCAGLKHQAVQFAPTADAQTS